jgi:hypothetical protein
MNGMPEKSNIRIEESDNTHNESKANVPFADPETILEQGHEIESIIISVCPGSPIIAEPVSMVSVSPDV